MDRSIIGDYKIIRELGKGPLGTVYLVEHRFIKRPFVLKLLPSSLNSDPQFYDRFQQHIQRTALLTHPNIVKVHNVSENNGMYFLVTDAILNGSEPLTFSDYLLQKKNKLSEKNYLQILSQIASALDYAHSKSVVHGMLKPNNILIKEHSGEPEVFISDFGLAPILGEGYLLTNCYLHVANSLSIEFDRANTKKEFTPALHESFLSAFEFLSPEQKNHHQASISSDAYAFGVLTYYMLTHSFPRGWFDLPSTLSPQLILNWDVLIKKCMETNPNIRPLSLTETLDEIRSPLQANGAIPRENTNASQDYTRQVSIDDLSSYNVPKQQPSFNHQPQRQEQYTQPRYQQRKEPERVEEYHVHRSEPSFQPSSYNPHTQFSDSLQPKAKQAEQFHSTVATVARSAERNLKPVIEPQEVQKPTYEPDPSTIFQHETVVAPYKPTEKEEPQIEPIQSDMIVIEGGQFYRGSDEGGRDERPMHKVIIHSFAIDVHPVTNEQFVRFLTLMGGEKDHTNNDIIRLKDSRIHKSGGKYAIESGYGRHPVVGITWYGAKAYAKWVGKRLPTEAEWEIASRSLRNDIIFPCGSDISKEYANYFSADTTEVCRYQPNEIGLYDMVGNVYEWCEDWYDYNYYQTSMHEPENPKGPHQGVYRVLRGGCWKSLKEDLRCAHRHRNNPGTTNNMYGFRCATNVS